MARRRRWRIHLTAAAETDFRNILRWTSEHFGETQAHVYSDTPAAAIEALTEGPDVIGSRKSSAIGEGVRVLHVARGGRKGRHFVLYRVHPQAEPPAIDVLRLLHDSMDLPRHVVVGNEYDR